jgi:2-polyprenyl-3-methyl-5-hydroxy-6-metoxy-1,4-benzoquinol methylase
MTRPTHNDQQIAYFTGRDLPRMDPVRRADTPYTQRHLDAVVAAARMQPGDRVVDVGCGPGKYTVGLAARGFDTTGIDLTPGLVEQLRQVAPTVTAIEGDLLDPPAELHGSFDVVTGFFVLHHLSDLDAAFAGTQRLARPGGRVVFIEPNAFFPGFYVQVTLTPGMSWKGDKGIVHMRAGRLRRAAAAAGLRDVAVTTFGAFPPALANKPWGRRLEARLENVPGWDRAKAFVVVSGTA